MTDKPPKRRKWFQFRLRTLLVAILVLSLPLAWLSGRMQKVSKQRKAVELLEKAVSLDPNFAEAWAWLADAHYSLPDFSITRKRKQHFERGRQAVARSLELNPDLPHVYHAAGYGASVEGDIGKVTAMFHKGHVTDPNDAEMKVAYGIGLNALGLFEKGLPLLKEGLAQEPLMPGHVHNEALAEWALGDSEAAGRSFRRSFELGTPEAAFCVDDV